MLNTLQPPALPLAVLVDFIRINYAIEGAFSPLEGERDQNWRLVQPDGTHWVVKICNPDEGMSVAECQAEALLHIAATEPALPVPRLRRAIDGRALPLLDHGRRGFPVMVLSWIRGEVLAEKTLGYDAIFRLGHMLGRLGLAMRGFVHGAPASRDLIWDTAKALRLESQVSNLAPVDRPLAEDIFRRHREVTLPAIRQMRSQIIHGDVHPHNCLVNSEGEVCGIIDFGDMVHGALIFDLANAIADFLNPTQDYAALIFEMVRGYCQALPLEEIEANVLLDLIEMRLLMTPLVDAYKAANGIAIQGYLQAFSDRSMPMIRALRNIDRVSLCNSIRRAAAFPPIAEPDARDLLSRRRAVMGEKLYIFYDPPLEIVQGQGVWLRAEDGRKYLDCYNNVPHVGHCHPYVTEAIARQARKLNTNTRYLTEQSIAYAERLVELCPQGLSTVVFVNSGSEANDLAWRMAKAWTGHSGGLAMEFAYHGVSDAIDAFSPSNAPDTWFAPHIRLLPPPDTYRGAFGPDDRDAGARYAALADPLIADLHAKGYGLAAAMIDSAFMTNGVLDAPAGYLFSLLERVRRAGGLFIADEVQSGFGRMGTAFWGHRHHGVVPDFITIGKPAGNGHPVGAVITRPEILSRFLESGPFFSTFGGNNVACAAGLAVLDVIRDEGLVENANRTGQYFGAKLTDLMARHDLIGDVRGIGLAFGVELVRDRNTKQPAGDVAPRLLNLLRDEGVLMGSEGRFGNVLKIRPPICFTRSNADAAAAALDRALTRL